MLKILLGNDDDNGINFSSYATNCKCPILF